MKTLKKIKLNQLSQIELENREMNVLRGGDDCTVCVCACLPPQDPMANNPIESSSNEASGYTPQSS